MKRKVSDLQIGDRIRGLFYPNSDPSDLFGMGGPEGYIENASGPRAIKHIKQYDVDGADHYVISVVSGEGMYMIPGSQEVEVDE